MFINSLNTARFFIIADLFFKHSLFFFCTRNLRLSSRFLPLACCFPAFNLIVLEFSFSLYHLFSSAVFHVIHVFGASTFKHPLCRPKTGLSFGLCFNVVSLTPLHSTHFHQYILQVSFSDFHLLSLSSKNLQKN